MLDLILNLIQKIVTMEFGIILSLTLISLQQIDLKLYLILGFRLKLSCALI